MLWARIRSLIAGLARRSQMESGMNDEMDFHIETRADDLAARYGLPREEALRRARLEFGSRERFKEEARQSAGLQLFDELRMDVRLAVRNLAKSPGFTLAAILTLALGIGPNTTIFSLVDYVLLKSLPVRNPDELVAFWTLNVPDPMRTGLDGSCRPDPEAGRVACTSLSQLTFERIRDRSNTLVDVFGHTFYRTLNAAVDGQSEIASGQFVTGGFFTGLGVAAAFGRTILPFDDNADAPPVAVVNYRSWQTRFGGAPSAVGRTIELNGVPVTIVGVAAETFLGTRVTETADFWIPIAQESRLRRDGGATPLSTWWVQVMGRVRPGVSLKQVEDDVRGIYEASVHESWNRRPIALRAESDADKTGIPDLKVVEGRQGVDGVPGGAADLLSIFFAIVGMILLIVCANLANLFMARASARRQEISVRLAIGAGRFRLVRQLLTESILIALLGGSLGALFAIWLKNLPTWFIPMDPTEPYVFHPEIDLRVLVFTGLLSVLTGVIFGLWPGLRLTRRAYSETPLARHQAGSRESRSLISKAMLVAQVSVSLVLLVGAGLLIGTVRNLQRAEPGFNPANLVVFDVDPSLNRYDATSTPLLYERMVQRIEAVPGVRSATMSRIPLLVGSGWTDRVATERGIEIPSAFLQAVRSNFFETMEIPLVAGRSFGPDDTSPVTVINQALAGKLFPDVNPVGSHLRTTRGQLRQVVGVVRDSKYSRLRGEGPPTMFLPYNQIPPSGMTFEIRTAIEPGPLIPAIRNAVREIDSRLPLFNVTTQDTRLRESLSMERMIASFAGVFGIGGLLLACIGLYGIVSYGVTQRTGEIGIRMALGARRSDVTRMVVRETIAVTLIGIVLGLGLALGISGLIANLLYGVTPRDPATIAAVVVLMLMVSMFAAYLPARRASLIDPLSALRHE